MSKDRIENIANFIDTIIDELANSDIKFVKGIKTIFRVGRSGKNVIDGENNTAFNNFMETLRGELKKLAKSPRTDGNHLRKILDKMKDFLNDEESLINYYSNKGALVEKIRDNTSIPRESELPNAFANIIIDNITKLVTVEEWSKAIYDALTELSIESCGKFENLYALNLDIKETVVQGFGDIQQEMDALRQDMHNISHIPQASQQSQTIIKDDSKSYLQDFNRRLFLDIDSPEINLKSMYVSPRVIEKEHKFATDAIMYLNHQFSGDENKFAADVIMDWYNDWDDYTPTTMFVFGNAGVGKSSLCAKMVSDAENSNTDDEKDYFIPKEKLHVCRLRSHIKKIENNGYPDTIKELIGILFNIDLDKYEFDDDIFVLDGFDEFCVLTKEERLIGHIIDKFAGFSSNDFKVLITSRKSEQYFSDISIDQSENIKSLNLKWYSSSVAEWCRKYELLAKSEEIKNWCRTFPEKYKRFPKNSNDDKRHEIFCVPIILYISANTKINVEKNDSVGRIYDEAFRKISHRNYGKKQKDMDVFDEKNEEKQRLINWQFTKEAAYQMFLNDTLYVSDTRDSMLLDNAKNRTVEILNKKGYNIKKEDIKIRPYLAMFHFARPGSEGEGIEFAHKTVYEYFTAVKLYEDYFAEITEDYPINLKKKTDAFGNVITPLENVWTNIIEAFRYKSIPEEIFAYLNKMNRPVYNGKAEENLKNKFDYDKFERYYIEGMKQRVLADLQIMSRIKEYTVNYDMLPTQIGCSFRNLTWFLTGHGYCNKEDINECKNVAELIPMKPSTFNSCNLYKWKLNHSDLSGTNLSMVNLKEAELRNVNLEGVNLSKANLFGAIMPDAKLIKANLSGADMYKVDLKRADLKNANLSGADMYKVDLKRADLKNANLSKTNLYQANLSGVDLNEANIADADLNGATYCFDSDCETKFPNDFNPKNHGMIEVDLEGNPISRSKNENITEEQK